MLQCLCTGNLNRLPIIISRSTTIIASIHFVSFAPTTHFFHITILATIFTALLLLVQIYIVLAQMSSAVSNMILAGLIRRWDYFQSRA